MGKLVLGLVAAAVLSGGSQRMTGMTITPTPPQVGDTITITHPGPFPVTVELDWHPSGNPRSLTITSDAGGQVVVPAGATSLLVIDTTGAQKSVGTMIAP